jgi:hypothetical protein
MKLPRAAKREELFKELKTFYQEKVDPTLINLLESA